MINSFALISSRLAYRSEREVAEFALGRVFFVVHPPALALQMRHLVLGHVELVRVAQLHVDLAGRGQARVKTFSFKNKPGSVIEVLAANPTEVNRKHHLAKRVNAEAAHSLRSTKSKYSTSIVGSS